MREISSGVYNLLKSTRRQRMSVSALLHSVDARDEHLEANLSTMLQSVRGTKQFWYTKQSELRCMIRMWGSPTLFLTFSCAEYESPEIDRYLRKVNDVPPLQNVIRVHRPITTPMTLFNAHPIDYSSYRSPNTQLYLQVMLPKVICTCTPV